MTTLDPELDVAAAAMVAEGAKFVVIGGFAVIANRFVRATVDIDFLVPDEEQNDRCVVNALLRLNGVRHRDAKPLRPEHLIRQTHLRAVTDAGIVDIMRGGLPPLDFETVAAEAEPADYGGVTFSVAGLRSIVGFKRLSDRPQDRNDLLGLEQVHGELPIDPIRASIPDQPASLRRRLGEGPHPIRQLPNGRARTTPHNTTPTGGRRPTCPITGFPLARADSVPPRWEILARWMAPRESKHPAFCGVSA